MAERRQAYALRETVRDARERERVTALLEEMARLPFEARFGFLACARGRGFWGEPGSPFPGDPFSGAVPSGSKQMHAEAHVERYIEWALAREELGIPANPHIPLDPDGLLRKRLAGPFERRAPDGIKRVFYNAHYDPHGCVVV